jgi:hypothetical protein
MTGGNKDGMKVFTFEAQTSNLCKEWMNQLCEATGSLYLKAREDGTDGYIRYAQTLPVWCAVVYCIVMLRCLLCCVRIYIS